MKVPGIEEVQETFMAGANEDGQDNWVRRGLLAVFETHVRQMLIAVYLSGGGSYASADQYVNRIIAQLKEPRHD